MDPSIRAADPAQPPRRLAICSAVAEGSTSVRLLASSGFTIRAGPPGSVADIVLPATRGGSLAFVLHSGALNTAGLTRLAERAAQASRAARRCSILWLASNELFDDDTMEALQLASPPGVNIIVCSSHEDAVEHMLACSQRMAEPYFGLEDEAEQCAADRVSSMFAALWGADRHAVNFMLAARPLSSLARVTSEDQWQQLLLETDGLLDAELLYTAVDWLQRDQVLLCDL